MTTLRTRQTESSPPRKKIRTNLGRRTTRSSLVELIPKEEPTTDSDRESGSVSGSSPGSSSGSGLGSSSDRSDRVPKPKPRSRRAVKKSSEPSQNSSSDDLSIKEIFSRVIDRLKDSRSKRREKRKLDSLEEETSKSRRFRESHHHHEIKEATSPPPLKTKRKVYKLPDVEAQEDDMAAKVLNLTCDVCELKCHSRYVLKIHTKAHEKLKKTKDMDTFYKIYLNAR